MSQILTRGKGESKNTKNSFMLYVDAPISDVIYEKTYVIMKIKYLKNKQQRQPKASGRVCATNTHKVSLVTNRTAFAITSIGNF